DYVLVNAGSGALTFGTPSSPGIPRVVSETVIVADFNNVENLEEIFAKYGDKIAAVLVEPVLGNIGVIPPEPDYLENVQKMCNQNGSLFILDEVITGFRFGYKGYQNIEGLNPDLTILGKIIGGGFPIGLFGGNKEIMKMISPSGKVYQSGTFSANPATMSAGLATLKYLKNADYSYLKRMTDTIADILNPYISEHEITMNRY
ncbi:glutamate-1-semialdehyde aminotransferase, partial [mine drainage metagenome]